VAAERNFDVAVIGAGVVGLAIARAVARRGREVVVLETAGAIGTGVSSRNSEVIHAGVYDPRGSLKAKLCVAGRRALYDYCAARGVPHRRLGKLVVATSDDEVATLDGTLARGRENGVEGLRLLSRDEARALEPALACSAALLSPESGIVDAHGLMRALEADARAAGADVALRAPVIGGAPETDGVRVDVGGSSPASLRCRSVIVAAGLDAQAVAASLGARAIPPRHLAKGHYYDLRGPSPFSRLVYPVPVAGGLGVHLTLDLGGHARFGPDVTWVDAVDYTFDESRAPAFVAAIRRYWPGLPDGALAPGTTGIRPKLSGPGAPPADFQIQGPDETGVPGLVCLYGIESPGLTASLAIADHTAALLAR
jgi:L-2-hydroxyglutarate oxidase LhgO